MLRKLLASTKNINLSAKWKRCISAAVIPTSKYDEAESILHQCYQEEPLTQMFNYKESDFEAQHRYDRDVLKEGMSIMIIEPPRDKIIAVLLNGPLKFPEDTSELFIHKNDSPFNKLNSLINLAYQFADIPAVLRGNTAYEHKMIAVTPVHRKSGITKIGVLLAFEVATKLNISTHLGTPTNQYTTKLSKKMGFKVIKSIPFKDFRDENGNQLINNIPLTNSQIDVIQRDII